MHRPVGHPLGFPGGERLEVGGVEHLRGTEIAGQAPAALPRLHGDHRPDAAGHQRGDGQCPDGPGPDDHHRVAGPGPGAGDPVQGDRQGFGQRGMAGREPLGQPQDPGGADEDELGEGAVAVFRDEGAAVLTLGRLAFLAPPAGSALR